MVTKRIFVGGVFVSVMVLGVAQLAFGATTSGCTATTKFNPQTGQPCATSQLIITDLAGTVPDQSAVTQAQKVADAARALLIKMQASGQKIPTSLKLVAQSYKGLFTKTLTVGSKDDEVKLLQQFLNLRGFTIAKTGPGSPDNESTYFGPATQKALVKFQVSVGIKPASGLWGPMTRAVVEALSK